MPRGVNRLEITAQAKDEATAKLHQVARSVEAATSRFVNESKRLTKQNYEAHAASEKLFSKLALGTGIVTSLANSITGLATGALSAFAGFVKESIAASMAEEQQQLRLVAALKLRGEFTERAMASLLDFNRGIQDATGLGGEEITSLQARLSHLGVHTDALKTATKMTLTWANVTGKDAMSAATDIGKAFQGNIAPLHKYIRGIDDAESAVKILMDKWPSVTAEARTQTGEVKKLATEWGELKENIGKTLSAALNLPSTFADYNKVLRGVNESIDEFRKKSFGEQIKSMATTALQSINPLRSIWLDGLVGAWEKGAGAQAKSRIETEKDNATKAVAIAQSAELANKERALAKVRAEAASREAVRRAAEQNEELLRGVEEKYKRENKLRADAREAADNAEQAYMRLKEQEADRQGRAKADQKRVQEDQDREQWLKQFDTQGRAQEQQAAQAEFAAGKVARSFQGAFGSVIKGTQSVSEAFGAMVLNIVEEVLANLAIMALATLFSGGTAGFFGLAGEGLGAGSIIGKLFGMRRGGIVPSPRRFDVGGLVTGGRPGEDSVPALLTPGELVVPVAMTRQLLSVARNSGLSDRYNAGGVVKGSARAVNIAINPIAHGAVVDTGAMDRSVEQSLLKSLRRLKDTGSLDLALGRT